MPEKTEHDYAHKPTLFNLIACQRSSDNHIHMTGCLCHNIEAKHFWFDQPAVSRCVNSDMSAIIMSDKFWTVFPSLNLTKVLNPLGADEAEIVKTLEHNNHPMILAPYGACMADIFRLLPEQQTIFLFIPLSDMPVMSVINRLMNLVTFRRAIRNKLQSFIQHNVGVELNELQLDAVHDMLDIISDYSGYRSYQTQPMSDSIERAMDNHNIGVNGANIVTMVKKTYYNQTLKPGMTVRVDMKPSVVGRGHLPVYEGVIDQARMDEDGIYLHKTRYERSNTYLDYQHIDRIEILSHERS